MVDIRADSTAAIASLPTVRNSDLRPKRTFDPMIILWIALALVLGFLIVNPLLRLIIDSFRQVNGTDITLARITSRPSAVPGTSRRWSIRCGWQASPR
jgi:hypothetical protein